MDRNTEKALDNITIKIDELLTELEKSDISDDDKIKQAYVYYNIFKFIRKENFEHNLAVLNNDALKRKFGLTDLEF